MKAVIMAGGQGTRFWPVSRQNFPKQFLKLQGKRTLIQETVARLAPLLYPPDIYVVCGTRYVEQVRTQLPALGEDQVIAEPVSRNTAPCVGLAALHLQRRCPGEVMAVLPSDHVIEEKDEFHRLLQAAEELARQGWLVTFGVEPSYPATGYGYLERGEPLSQHPAGSACRVKRFTEKPDRGRAERFLQTGCYYWNSGMFVWSVDTILHEIEIHLPRLHEALLAIDRNWDDPAEVHRVFAGLEKISIDFGVMEKAEKVAMLPCRLGWNDVGNWKSLEEVLPADDGGVVASGRYLAIESRDSVIYTLSEKLVTLVGVKNLVVVETPDALLVCERSRTEEVRKVVDELKTRGWEEYL